MQFENETELESGDTSHLWNFTGAMYYYLVQIASEQAIAEHKLNGGERKARKKRRRRKRR